MAKELIDGILWDIAWIVFLAGIAWNILAFLIRGVKRDLAVPRGSGLKGAVMTNLRRFFPHHEVTHRIRLQVVAGYAFHVGLLILLFFARPHVEFVRDTTGIGWAWVPDWVFDLAYEFAFAGLLLLLLYRLLSPVTRLISRTDSYLGSILVLVVMFSGCMAMLESFEGLRLFHRFTVELLLIYFPFSSLMHAFLFVPSRGYTGAMYGRRGVDV